MSSSGDRIKIILYIDGTRNKIEDTIPRSPNCSYPKFISRGKRVFQIYYPFGYVVFDAPVIYYDEILIESFTHLKHGIHTKRR